MERTNQPTVVIDFYADYMCPLCYIGKVNLEKAISELPYRENVKVVYHPFQLYPNAPLNKDRIYYEYTSKTHNNISVDYVKEANKNVIALAKSVGLNYDLDKLIPTNTTDALRLTLYAQEKGKHKELSQKLYNAYFVEGLDIADAETLIQLSSEIGLDKTEIRDILPTDRYKNDLKSSRMSGERIGISGTPFFIINNKYAISGVKPKEVFIDVLNKTWAETDKD
ncbi:hypothetical protein A4H97_21570 [Niastella yeongjuensis]|uniref:DSBA-like thioredoxin domain-containing protein n=1 Tax=Niastella yeongjuensis TaxID=354355 RepID=A0A1V9F8G2_9BACT|nr:DsbA family oxidoreductase [Niastella yeongjuensis]OQP54561.1 hypothetical protein A4H97_21570 [Niastella yeongjuensis]SEN99008.1 Predicted dithiol-disulfide isomerase, DsbA family [Niastella yeongjuensis]